MFINTALDKMTYTILKYKSRFTAAVSIYQFCVALYIQKLSRIHSFILSDPETKSAL